jgi:zinc protease
MLHYRHLLATLCVCTLANAATATDIDIPYRKEVLSNGLTVIVHEDHKAPIVSVNIWYHVGSKNEVRGRTGFAHLFEHLMFQGTENYDKEFIAEIERLGASDFNATTWYDRTNYFQTVPVNALDRVLWLESDRMGHFIGAVTQAKLDEQRGVVQNEKRQGDNQPYGKVWEILQPQLFPSDHPYSWETIGSMADLNAATLDDVREWFRTWYGPDNAVLAIAGDIDTDAALEKVRHYFGDIPPGPPLARPMRWIPRLVEDRRLRMEDRVSQPRLYQAWTGPAWGTAEATHLSLAASVLAGDKNSRLYQRLVYRDKLATDVAFGPVSLELAGITYLMASAQPGVELPRIEAAAAEELQRFMRKGPTAKELERVRAQARAGFLKGIERVGGYSGKAGVLAESMVFGGSPDFYKQEIAAVNNATPEDLRRAVADWLDQGAVTLEVLPVANPTDAASGADRSAPPGMGQPPPVAFAAFERAQLDNGLQLIVAPRPGLGFVEMELVLDGGYAADPAQRPGTATMTMSMLDEGTRSRSALEISEELALLGAALGSSASVDSLSVRLSALADKLEPAMEVFTDVALNPVFPASELERLRGIHLAGLRQEKTRPTSMALRVLPKLLYGEGHAYAQPLTGSGTEQSLQAINRDELAAFHAAWFRPGRATLVVAGDTSLAALRPLAERLFGNWSAGPVPAKPAGGARPAPGDVLYVIDRPASDQSVIFAGLLVPPKSDPGDLALQTMNSILGGLMSARLNMNLREDKHWSYGAYSFILDTRGERPLLAYAPVQSDKTRESLQELRAELLAIGSSRPPLLAELDEVKRTETLSLPGRWETAGSVAGAISELVRFGLADDYWSQYAGRINALSLADVAGAASTRIRPEAIVWVVVGDRAKIEPSLKDLGFSAIRSIEAD